MLRRVLALCALCAAAGFAQDVPARMLGKWRSVETSKGGIGAVIEFYSGGAFDYSPGAVIGGKYQVVGRTIVTTYANGDPGNTTTIESLTARALRLGLPGNSGSLDLRRVGTPTDPKNLLLGAWVTPRTMQGLPNYGYYYFRRDGTETFVIPFRTDHCTYSISGGRIRMTMPARGSIEGVLRWEGGVLVLPWRSGEAKFERF